MGGRQDRYESTTAIQILKDLQGPPINSSRACKKNEGSLVCHSAGGRQDQESGTTHLQQRRQQQRQQQQQQHIDHNNVMHRRSGEAASPGCGGRTPRSRACQEQRELATNTYMQTNYAVFHGGAGRTPAGARGAPRRTRSAHRPRRGPARGPCIIYIYIYIFIYIYIYICMYIYIYIYIYISLSLSLSLSVYIYINIYALHITSNLYDW